MKGLEVTRKALALSLVEKMARVAPHTPQFRSAACVLLLTRQCVCGPVLAQLAAIFFLFLQSVACIAILLCLGNWTEECALS